MEINLLPHPAIGVQQPPFTHLPFPKFKAVRLEEFIRWGQLPRGKVCGCAEECIHQQMNKLRAVTKKSSRRDLKVGKQP